MGKSKTRRGATGNGRPTTGRPRRRPEVAGRRSSVVVGLWSSAAILLLGFLGWRLAAGSRAANRDLGQPAAPAPVAGGAGEERRLREAVARHPADPGPRLDLARYDLRQGRIAEAVWEYEEVVGVRPDAAAAHAELATALGRLRLHDVAISLLEEQVRRASPAVVLRRELAERYLSTGRPEQAVTALASDAAGVRAMPAAALTLGRAYLALGRVAAARDAFQQEGRATPGDPERDFWLGRVAWASGQAAPARRFWERAAAAAPTDPRFPYSLGLSYARDVAPGSVDRAGQAFDEALRRDLRYAPAVVQLGLLFQRHHRNQDAARHFLQAIGISPMDPEPHRHLADALAALGEKAEAHRRRGLYYSLSDQPARAILEYERLQAIDPDGIDAPVLISQSYVQMQQNERAVAVLERALKRHPRHPVLSERLATLYVLMHSPKEAEATCREWLRGDPEAARARWVLGRVAYADHRIEEAARQYEEALTRAPDEAEFCVALGGALEQLGGDRRARALTLLRRAAEMKPDAADYRYRLGVAYQQRGEWEPARRELMAALDLDPRHAGAYNALTQVAQGLQQPHLVRLWAQAMRAVQEREREETSGRLAAGARPRDPAVWLALAQTLLRAGELEQAQGQLEQSLWLRPGWPEARRELARVAALRAVR